MPQAVVVLYDIRSFSRAAKRISEALFGAFITEAHSLIKSYLCHPAPTFTKNLGDGLLLLWQCGAEQPPSGLVAGLLRGCFEAAREYKALVARQSFAGAEHLPRELGFGVTLGTVTRGDDWYGNAINLAARLQDCARPRGVVLSAEAFAELPSPVTAFGEPLRSQRALLKGVGRVRYYWFGRLTRRERAERLLSRLNKSLFPLLAPILIFGWADSGLLFPGGEAARGAIDTMNASLLRPHDRLSTISTRDRGTQQLLHSWLVRRFDSKTGRVYGSPGESRDFFAWGDGQTLVALLAQPISPQVASSVARDLDELFAGQRTADGKLIQEFVEGRGFWRHPLEPYPHYPATAWVFLALLRAHAQPALFADPTRRARIEDYTARVWQALRAFYDPTCGAWHWRLDQVARDLHGEAQLDNQHAASAYNAALATWALVEARRLDIELPQRDALLASSAQWLVRHYIPAAHGWGAEFFPADAAFLPNETDGNECDGLTLQIYAILLAVERDAPQALVGGRLPRDLVRALHGRLRDLKERTLQYPLASHRWVIDVVGDDGRPRRERDLMSFFWLPWAHAAARMHLRLHATELRSKVEILRALSLISRLAQQVASAPNNNQSYALAELAVGASFGDSPQPGDADALKTAPAP